MAAPKQRDLSRAGANIWRAPRLFFYRYTSLFARVCSLVGESPLWTRTVTRVETVVGCVTDNRWRTGLARNHGAGQADRREDIRHTDTDLASALQRLLGGNCATAINPMRSSIIRLAGSCARGKFLADGSVERALRWTVLIVNRLLCDGESFVL